MNSIDKRKETVLDRFGVDNVAKLSSVQDKRRITFSNKRNDLIFYQEPRIHNIDGHSLSIYRLDKEVSDKWLDTYHPFGSPKGTVLSLGLVDSDVIYAIMAFKKSRNYKYIAELSRLYMLPTYNIIEGYQILSDYASKMGISSVIAYVNLSFENIHDYESIGMKYVKTNQKTKWWFNGHEFISDASRRQKNLSTKDMTDNKYLPYYDIGTAVYSFG